MQYLCARQHGTGEVEADQRPEHSVLSASWIALALPLGRCRRSCDLRAAIGGESALVEASTADPDRCRYWRLSPPNSAREESDGH